MAIPRFVGRERELERLHGALDAALHGQTRVVLLAGEPGIGKTRTAQELDALARQGGAEVLWGRAEEFAGTPPYWPWVQIARAYAASTTEEVLQGEVRPYAGELQRLFPAVRELIDGLDELDRVESEEARFRLFDAASALIRDIAKRTPLVLVLDDLHWADRSSLLMLTYLIREIADARLLIVCCCRDGELESDHPLNTALAEMHREPSFERIHLRGLPLEETAGYVREVTGVDPHPALLARIHAEADGNPFFLTEIVRLMEEEGVLTDPHHPGAAAIPEGVRKVLGRRLQRLSPEVSALLTTAAVVGREFDHALLAALGNHHDEELLTLLDEALTAGVIEEIGVPGEFRFVHALMRETLLAGVSSARRARLHGEIAEALSETVGPRPVSELAAHYVASATLNQRHARRAAHYSRLAAEEARAQLAWDEAAQHYERCLDLVRAHEDRLGQDEAAIWLELALSRLANFRLQDWEPFERAFALWPEGDPMGLARGLLRALALFPNPPLIRLFQPAIDRVLTARGRAPSPETCALLALKALALRGPEGDAAAADAHESAVKLELTGEHYPTLLHARPALAAFDDGRLAEAATIFTQLQHQLLGTDPSATTTALALTEWAAGRLEQAEHAFQELIALSRTRRRRRTEHGHRAWLAHVPWRRGDLDAAAELLRGMPPDMELPAANLLRAEMSLVAGDLERALAEIPDHEGATSSIRAERLGARCRALHLGGQVALAHATFREWRSAFDAVYEPDLIDYLYAIHAIDDTLCELADEELLLRIRRRLRPLRELRNWWMGSGLDHLRGAIELRLGSVDAAAQWFDTGRDWARHEGVPLVEARCLQGLAAVAEQRGDPATARLHLDPAAELFGSLGAEQYRSQVVARLDELPARAPARPQFPDGLSPREVEVLQLIASGRSNQEIADTLVISINTVERHVSHIYTKAQLANRAEAASYAHRHDLA